MKRKMIFGIMMVLALFVLQGQAVFAQSFSLDGFDDFRALPNGYDLNMFNSRRPERHTERTLSVGVGFDRSNPSRMLLMIIYNDGSEITYVFENGFISDEQAIYLVRKVSPYNSQPLMGSMRRWKNEGFGGTDVSGIVTIEIYDGSGRVLVLAGTLRNTPLRL
jgi:hypothetical protein